MCKLKEEKSHVVLSLQSKVESAEMSARLFNKVGSCCGADTCDTGRVSGTWAKGGPFENS